MFQQLIYFIMKNTLLKIVILMIAVCSFTSCTVYRTYEVSKRSEYTNKYVGKSHNQIVTSLGAPDRQASDGANGTILIYEQTTISSNSVQTAYNVNYYTNTYTPGVYTNTYAQTSYLHLYISPNGTCYKVNTNHKKYVTEVDEEATAKSKKTAKIMGITLGSFFGASLLFSLIMILI